MADYFTHFSTVLERLSAAEERWLMDEYSKMKKQEDPDTGGTEADFELRLEGDNGLSSVWFHDDGETGNFEQVARFVQRFLNKFRPGECWGFEWSYDCSKPRLDAYGGGAVFVTTKEIRWLLTNQWLEEQMEAGRKKRRARRKEAQP
jgi:hypothetical protein